MSQRKTRPKKVVTAQQKGEGRAKQKKKDEREETRERKSQKTRIIYSDKDMK